MVSRFEQAASTKEVAQRESQLSELVRQLPECNRVLLAWVTLHLDHITVREKTTKMNAQTIAMTLSPVLQMSHRLLLALLCHCKALFSDIQLAKYIPPLPSGSANLPDEPQAIALELVKQESLLAQIHMQMNDGFVTKSREEQLWEVQRIITQLKRKYKIVQKLEGQIQKSLDEDTKSNDESHGNLQKPIDQSHNSTQAITTTMKNLQTTNAKSNELNPIVAAETVVIPDTQSLPNDDITSDVQETTNKTTDHPEQTQQQGLLLTFLSLALENPTLLEMF